MSTARPLECLRAGLEERCTALFAAPPSGPGEDVDCLVFGPVEDVLPERRFLSLPEGGTLPVDLLWVPAGLLEDAEGFAAEGLLVHRLLASDLVLDSAGTAAAAATAVRRWFPEPPVRRRRIRGFLETADLTVRELAVTQDFPALGLFWMHMAHAATLAALCDALGRPCPNVFTRPLDHLEALARAPGLLQVRPWEEALRLHAPGVDLEGPLRRIQRRVSADFPEPEWPACMRPSTRWEYRYFRSRRELDWRLAVAAALERAGRRPAAVFFLRFWAYALARLPVVHRRALEGRDVPYLRPECALRPALEELCPEILEDLGTVLGHAAGPAAVARARDAYQEFRGRVDARLDAMLGATRPS